MRIIWSQLAFSAFEDIRNSISEKFGIDAGNHYSEDVNAAILQVSNYPNSGIAEYRLSADGSVRSVLVNRRSRIIFYTENDCLYIADVWDVRQKPETLTSRFVK